MVFEFLKTFEQIKRYDQNTIKNVFLKNPIILLKILKVVLVKSHRNRSFLFLQSFVTVTVPLQNLASAPLSILITYIEYSLNNKVVSQFWSLLWILKAHPYQKYSKTEKFFKINEKIV